MSMNMSDEGLVAAGFRENADCPGVWSSSLAQENEDAFTSDEELVAAGFRENADCPGVWFSSLAQENEDAFIGDVFLDSEF